MNVAAAEYQSIFTARQIIKLVNKKTSATGVSVHTYSFPHPTTGAAITVDLPETTSFTHPSFRYKGGLSFGGKSTPKNIPLSAFEGVGLTTVQAKALKFVSENEGGFDSVNSWDKAVFSWGFIQFAGVQYKDKEEKVPVMGSLPRLLLSIKQKEPAVFQDVFRKFGIDIDQVGTEALISVAVPDNKSILTGKDAFMYINTNKQMSMVFVRAGYHPTVIVRQIAHAKTEYVNPALVSAAVKVVVGGQTIDIAPLSKVIRSEAGQASMIDITVNRWITKLSEYYKYAIEQVATADKLTTLDQITRIDEKKVLMKVLEYVNKVKDGNIINRTNHLFQPTSGLSFVKK